ncbi:hypothetical protein Pcinc_002288 [Petrolisthes cinctipes]|uniref:Uncharacterized protein n=1 Tax=Petrolisthes cinctipes TaxID=88211 RepID=A0AAE1GJ27_PETCI|nr:hypothetical protein Pcinc_002288 [Petrolisthes cinctipes]
MPLLTNNLSHQLLRVSLLLIYSPSPSLLNIIVFCLSRISHSTAFFHYLSSTPRLRLAALSALHLSKGEVPDGANESQRGATDNSREPRCGLTYNTNPPTSPPLPFRQTSWDHDTLYDLHLGTTNRDLA